MSYRFICDHCGKKFELEIPEAKECPFCFWASSVKREDALASEKKNASYLSSKAPAGSGRTIVPGNFSRNLMYLFRTLFFLALLAGVGFLAYKGYKKFFASSFQTSKVFSIKPPSDVPRSKKASVVLSAEEKEVLSREVKVPVERIPGPGEQKILGRVAPFQTGSTEKLPSAVWTLEQYQKMIADQEAFYKMPFSKSYKKKLKELFETKYLAAADAFAQGDALAARNLWMESLAFPPYSSDIKKHRAVALTMLRPFINDTLLKVSAMNQSVMDRSKRAKEMALSGEYQKLTGLIAYKKWPEALALIGQMLSEVDQLRKNVRPQEVLPPYPAPFGMIDADLQRPLMDLMTPNPSSTADLQPLQQDLVEKKEVIETFTEAYVKSAEAAFRSALELIRAEKWQEAVQVLGAIQGPPVLQRDAMEKITILGKMIPETLDSSEKTS